MMLLQLLLIFVVIPAVMVGIATLGPAAGRVVAYGIFPLALAAFAITSYVRNRSAGDVNR